MQEVKVMVAGENATLNVLTGTLPDPFNVKPLSIEGNINTPKEYHSKRASAFTIDCHDSHVVFKKDLSKSASAPVTVTLVQRAMQENKVTVTGTLKYNEEYTSFGINRDKKYTLDSLAKFLKRQRPFFADVTVYESILKKIQTFTAHTTTEFTQNNDYKGNVAFQKIQKCKTNLDYDFQLAIPLYMGGKKQIFSVNIEFEPAEGSIVCWFDSPEAHILEIEERNDIYNEQLAYFQTVQNPFPVIEI